MEIIKSENCFTFVVETLKRRGVKVPGGINGLEYDKEHILKHSELYLQKKLHELYISSFAKEVKNRPVQKNDIITHTGGIGIVADRETYVSLHRGKLKAYPINGICKIWRVKNGW